MESFKSILWLVKSYLPVSIELSETPGDENGQDFSPDALIALRFAAEADTEQNSQYAGDH